MTRTTARQRSNSKRARIDREFSHQVALPDDFCCMENNGKLMAYCRERGVPYETTWVTAVWPIGPQIKYRLYCFPAPEAAETFAAHFDGILFDPRRDRRKGLREAWDRTDLPSMPVQCGPLRMPRYFVENP